MLGIGYIFHSVISVKTEVSFGEEEDNMNKKDFIGSKIIRIDNGTIYLNNGATIAFHYYETYFNTVDGDCLSTAELMDENKEG